METSKTDHYEKLWEKQSTSEYIGNGFLLLVLLTTNEEAICYTLGYFFFFISSNNCPQVSKLFIVQIHSKKKHCHYLIQRLNTFVKVIANEETPVLALFHPMERSSVTVPNCQKSCKLPLLIIEPPTRRNIVSMPLKVICDVCVCILLSNAYCFVNTE